MQRPWDVAGLLAISIERQRDQVSRRKLHRIPHEHDAGLSGILAAEDGRRGFFCTKGLVDLVLKLLEGGLGGGFSTSVARYSDVDYAAGGDVGRKENRWELDLMKGISYATEVYAS